MCGISAAVYGVPGKITPLQDVCRMHQALRHRGPDGEGFLSITPTLQPHLVDRPSAFAPAFRAAPKCAIAFRRLRIQDVRQEADQPLARRAGRLWIVLNGEIYNFRDLRQVLTGAGYSFRTKSDTEVALAAYEHWGTACFEQFNGMWALLIVDLERGLLVGSRDRLGIKPLFYAVDTERLLVASEPQALAAVLQSGPQIEPYRLTEFLCGLPPQSANLSFFAEVHPVPSATFFQIDLTSQSIQVPTFHRFWDLAAHVRTQASLPGLAQAEEELAGLLHSAVAYQRSADVPVGSLLSGGLDSSCLTRLLALAADRDGKLPQTFSLVYDDPAMDESMYIAAVVQMGGIINRRALFTPAQAWALVDHVVAAQGEPLLGYDLLAQYYAYQVAREHGAIVILDGQGADELLGGYGLHEHARVYDLLTSGQWRLLYAELGMLHRASQRPRLRHLLAHLRAFVSRQRMVQTRGPTYDWLELRALPSTPETAQLGRCQEHGPDAAALTQLLYTETRHTNLPCVLLHQDRSSMAHGVESRVPYLDHRIVEWCFRLPAAYKVGSGQRKRILRHLGRRYLPPLVTERTDKKAFVSTTHWLDLRQAPMATGLRAMLQSPTMRQLPWLRRGPFERFVTGYLTAQHHDTLAIWRLYTTWRWLNTYCPTLPTRESA